MLLLSVEILENVCMHPPVLIIKFIVLMIDNQNRKVFFENDILCIYITVIASLYR